MNTQTSHRSRVGNNAVFALIASLLVGCGDLETVEPTRDYDPMTGVITSPIRFGTDDGDAHPGIMKLHIRVGNSGFLCSGTVIEQRTILTAAHCVENAAAASDVFVATDSGYVSASNMYIHEDYSADASHLRRVDNSWFRFSGPDLAIVTFARDLPGPVVSIGSDTPSAGDMLTIVGFGSNENEETGVRRQGVVEFAAVTATYDVDRQTINSSEGSLVVNPGPTNQVVCGGDSGGALLAGDQLIGVTSGGVVALGDDNPCVRAQSANFISASAYLPWIESKVSLPSQNQVEIADELLCTAFQLESTLNFGTPANFASNWGGLGEKWFQAANGAWHYILPEGAVYRWMDNSNPPTGELVGTLNPAFHDNPRLLTEASEPDADCPDQQVDAATLAQLAYDLDAQYGFNFAGSYSTNWGGRGEKWFTNGSNNWFFILPNGEIRRWENGTRPVIGELIGTLSVAYHGNPALVHDAEDPSSNAGCASDSVASRAYSLDQSYSFRFSGSFSENWGGRGEKWFQNQSGRWFYITPNGAVYRWTSNSHPAEGTLVDTLTSAYHTDPMLLIEAQAPSAESCEGTGLSEQAAELDRAYRFQASSSYNTNWGGQEEKWFTNASNNWFYILPNGEVYRWQMGTRPLVGTRIAQLSDTYYADPALLHDAVQ